MKSLFTSIFLMFVVSLLSTTQGTHAKIQSKQVSRSGSVKRKQTSVPKPGQRQANPKQIASNIEKLVSEDLNSTHRERLEHWNFYLNRDKKSLDVSEVGGPVSLDPSDPYMLPVKAQYDIKTLATFLQGSDIPASLWKVRLQAIRNVNYQTIVAIQSTKNKKKLLMNLEQRSKEIEQKVKSLKDFIIHFYEGKGYSVSLSMGNAITFPVAVATDPVGGTIRVLKYLNYRKCIVFGLQKSLWPWLTVNQNPAFLLGRYHYFVSWPDGKTAEGDMQVSGASPVVFRSTHR